MLANKPFTAATFLAIYSWMSFSYADQDFDATPNERSYYLDLRSYHNQGMQAISAGRLKQTTGQIKLGLRAKYDFDSAWLLRFDTRAVALGQILSQEDSSKSSNEAYLEIKRLYISAISLFSSTPSLVLHAGRQTFRDNNAWNYDTELDTLTLEFSRTLLLWKLAYGSRLFGYRLGDDEYRNNIEGSRFLIAEIQYQWHYKHYIGAYGLSERNNIAEDQTKLRFAADEIIQPRSRLNWYGVQARGEYVTSGNSFGYSGTLALLSGDTQRLSILTLPDTDRQIMSYENQALKGGTAIDFRLIWRNTAKGFALGFNYAAANGDDSGNNSRQYNQPSIASNKNRVLGTSRYRYYGEALNPKLSNLQILSLTAGFSMPSLLWFETAYHHYNQNKALPYIDASSPNLAPNGKYREIGQGLDFIFGGTIKNKQQVQLIASGFWGGKAFDGVAAEKTIYRALVNYRVSF